MSITLMERIGSGHFGNVYKAKKPNGDIFAVKIVRPEELKYIELDILTRLRSPYLIKSLDNGIVDTELGKGIAFELKENNISNLNVKKISYGQMKRIIMSCLYGIQCMHQNGFLHLDLSLENILYDIEDSGDITAFIADFGFSVRCNNPYIGIDAKSTTRKIYTPPEVLIKRINKERIYHFNDKTDIWSMGIIILLLLGANFTFVSSVNFYKMIENIDEDFIEEKIRMYNNNKMSPAEEMELKELLVNMLKLNPEKRISSKELKNCAFVKNNKLPDSCILERPRELFYLPYISPMTRKGIKMLEEKYLAMNKKNNLEEFFLAIQNYTRLMSRTKAELDEKELLTIVETSIKISNNYYDKTMKGDFETAEKLDGELGYNPYFYKAKSIDDLLILYHIISENDKILSFYNTLNVDDLFDIFRQDFEYTNVSKFNISVNDFMKMNLPIKKEKLDTSIIGQDYNNAFDNLDNTKSDIILIKEVEEIFRSVILEQIQKLMKEDKFLMENDKINMIYNLLEKNINSDIMLNIKRILGDKNITLGLAHLFNYGYIIIDNGEILTTKNSNKEFVIVHDDNKISLLHHKKGKIIHYYSDNNQIIADYYKEKGFNYEVNYSYGISKCCSIREPCIIFNIFYNQQTNKEDFSTKCLEKNTFFLIFVFLICQ
jgi:serine/threonine protein kinase